MISLHDLDLPATSSRNVESEVANTACRISDARPHNELE